MLLEIVKVPPERTVNPAPLISPLSQFITALLATVSGAFRIPKDILEVPCSVLLPDQFPTYNEPLGVSTVPVVLKPQLMVVTPLPPSLRNVPAFRKVFVPTALARVLSATAHHSPAL